jgi:hypothetical protein
MSEPEFSQWEWDQNEDEWSKLTTAWKARAERAEQQRDALLKELKDAIGVVHSEFCGGTPSTCQCHTANKLIKEVQSSK